jgi:hypothetical protein
MQLFIPVDAVAFVVVVDAVVVVVGVVQARCSRCYRFRVLWLTYEDSRLDYPCLPISCRESVKAI